MASHARLALLVLTCACAPGPRAAGATAAVAAAAPAARDLVEPRATDPPAEPPYDLGADRGRIEELARQELGPAVRAVVAQEAFVLIGAPGWDARALASSQALTVDAINAYFNHRFGKRPERAVAVYLFASAAPYNEYCERHLGGPCLSKYGSYHPDRRLIVMNAGLGLGTLTHELVHPIVESDFPGAPTWINEGIASLFEAPMLIGPGEITGGKNWRLPRLVGSLDAVRVEALFGMSDATFRDASEDLHYALARYLCQWLDERGWLFAFYQRWRDNVAADPTGARSFEAVTGLTPAKAQLAWASWVRRLAAPA